jgi:arachidonate 15-lipoxygenase
MNSGPGFEPTCVYQTTIPVSADKIWFLLAKWSQITDWWPYLYDMKVLNDVKGVGQIRSFKTVTGAYYEEELTALNNETFSLNFKLLNLPAGVTSIETNQTLKVLPNNQGTEFTYQSRTELAQPNPQQLAQIVAMQKAGYQNAAKALTDFLVIPQTITPFLTLLMEKIVNIERDLALGMGDKWEYAGYPEKYGPLPTCVRGIPFAEALTPHTVGRMMERLTRLQYFGLALSMQKAPEKEPTFEEKNMAALMKFIQTNSTAESAEQTKYLITHWENDEEFCEQLLQGVNPLSIKRVKDIKEIPEAMLTLKAEDKSVQDFIDCKTLFILDYYQLRNLEHYGDMYFYAPVMLVYQGKDKQLRILGIQLDVNSKTVYHKDDGFPNRYKLAKMYVGVADNQVHQFIYHLGLSHLSIEPIIVGTHNQLNGHFIADLLHPHFSETIGINYLARQTLVSESYALTDHTFAVGTKQALELFSSEWQKYDFFGHSFPEQLKSRGFTRNDNVDDYWYRDDGYLLWDALEDYTREIVATHYLTDADVAKDAKVQAWAAELADPNKANVKGFPKSIENKHDLAHVLQIIIWNASALHSAVNFPQEPYLGLIPNRPNALFLPMPADDGKDITPEYIQQCFPGTLRTIFQFTFSWFLSMPSETTLNDLSTQLKDKFPIAVKNLQRRFNVIEDKIELRNNQLRKKGKCPYTFLLPRNVASSVNI